jgi:hypothetical protein
LFRRSSRKNRTSHTSRTLNAQRPPRTRLGLELLEAREVPATNPIGLEFPVAQTPGGLYYPSIATAYSGNTLVAWTAENQDGSGNGVYARLFDPAGAPLTGEFRVNTTTAGHQLRPAVAALRYDGGFVAVWESEGAAYGTWDVRGQKFDVHGAPVGGEFAVNTAAGNHAAPAAAALITGGFVVGWQSYGTDGSGWGVYGRRYDAAAAPLDPGFLVNQTTAGEQYGVKVAASQAGFLFGWTGDSVGYGRAYQTDGTPRPRASSP